MAWTQADLTAAVAALDPGLDDGQAAAALNAQFLVRPGGVPMYLVRLALVLSRDWAAVERLARQGSTASAGVAMAPAESAAVCLRAFIASEQSIPARFDPAWPAVEAMMDDLSAAGALTRSTRATIEAGRVDDYSPRWQPPVAPDDVAAARRMGVSSERPT